MRKLCTRRTSRPLVAALALTLVLAVPMTAQTGTQDTAGAPAHGMASWYGEEFAGRTTANGEIFEPLLLTAAHRTLPFGTIVEVKNSKTGQTVRARVNDRGPLVAGRLIDLSYAAAREIGLIDSGSGEVDVTVVALGRGENEPPAPYTVTLAKLPAAPAAAPPAASAQTAAAAPLVTTATPATAPQTQPQPAPASAASAGPSPVKPAPATGEPPPVEFPLPADVARAASVTKQPAPVPAPAPAPTASSDPAEVSTVEVVTERKGVETRRQVSADGRSMQNVATATGEPVAPAAAAQPANQTPPARPAAPRGRRFFVQVGAFAQETNAKALVELLSGFSHKAHVAHDAALYKVRIGPFETREEAIRARNDLESKGVSAIVLAE